MMEVSRLAHRPEVDLLLCCAQTSLDSKKVDQVRALLHSEIDWPYLLRLAGAHGVLPLLYISLKKTFPDLVPPTILDQFHNHFLANAGRNLFLTEELLKLLNLFETDGIPAIPLKGPVLAISVYGDLALRMFSDLDIAVHRRDIQKAKVLLLSKGYRLDLPLTPEQEIVFLRSDLDGWFIRSDGRVRVEVQWGEPKDFPFPLDFERFWGRLRKAPLEGRMVWTFAPEDLIGILAMHGAFHCWERLIWICDLAELIRGYEGWDWKGLINQAERQGWRRILFLGLSLAHDLMDTDLPKEIWERVQADSVARLPAKQVQQSLFEGSKTFLGPLERSLFYLKITERLRDRMRYRLRLALLPTVVDWKAFPLPRSLFFLYHFIHPLRVTKKYGWLYLKQLFQEEFPS
jgi:hypothetical protein